MLPFVLTIASSRKCYFLREKWNLWQKNILTSQWESMETQQIIGDTRRWSWNKRSSLASSTKTLNLIHIAGDKLAPQLSRNSLQTVADPGAGEKSNKCEKPKMRTSDFAISRSSEVSSSSRICNLQLGFGVLRFFSLQVTMQMEPSSSSSLAKSVSAALPMCFVAVHRSAFCERMW